MDSKSFMIPMGVHGLKPSPTSTSMPWLTGWKPSSSLCGETPSSIFSARLWEDPVESLLCPDMGRQRKLDQNTVDVFVFIKIVNQRHQFPLGHSRGKQM